MKKIVLLGLALSTLVGVASAQNVTIKINGYGGTDPAVVGDLINRFVKPAVAKDNITVVYEPLQGDYNQSLTNLLSAGNAGDVFYLPGETVQAFAATNRLLPLNGLVSSTPFLAALNRTFTVNGKLYAIAKDTNSLAIVYNKDIFDEAKVAYPNANDTWTTFADKLRKVRQALGNDYYGICFPADYARMGAFAFAAGWRPFDSQGRTNVNTASFRRAFDFYTGLVKDKTAIQPSDLSEGWSGGCFAKGKVAAAIEGNWIVNFLRDSAPNLKYGTAPLPKDPTTNRRGNFLYTVGWAINANTKNKDAAVKVLQALTSVQAQTYILEQGLALPSRSALQRNAFFTKNTPESQAANIIFRGSSDGNVQTYSAGRYTLNDFQRPINEALTSVMTGQATTAQALQRLQTALNTLQRR
ncbi:ABC transporter substrate-binding protein [Deinococcus yavapaiensis]|uniref:Carbohydrate ABC transporter substrate-binding protein (CUT1 family) n=1 Tax=Deinococcus yavapaiensis KR-236 TaxID=694435 RepID=A0A318SEX4_9DEIO|nr:ABC transporter substrate-binding protein [Deinococcus yavapaiensis]PYE51899.1 carbohydrate ABC transporter substrate-binding protein (CUT1 family) [Deinococcus yavapaiensis KR-236]